MSAGRIDDPAFAEKVAYEYERRLRRAERDVTYWEARRPRNRVQRRRAQHAGFPVSFYDDMIQRTRDRVTRYRAAMGRGA